MSGPLVLLWLLCPALGVLCCFAFFVCLTLLASFFLACHLSLRHVVPQMLCAENRAATYITISTSSNMKLVGKKSQVYSFTAFMYVLYVVTQVLRIVSRAAL